jgi:predicted DCC family thiol-disulfide oxidoreductase YuxK
VSADEPKPGGATETAPAADSALSASEPIRDAGRGARWRWFADQYLTIDARSLGLGRIYLAIVLLVDLLRRVPDITLFYSNLGLVPNHMMLWRPPTQWMFSFFFIFSLPEEVAFGFLLCGLVYFGLLIGWKTRLMQFLALICVLSLHGRVTLMENGGDWMLGELALWSAFLPCGRRFSVDAVLASLRRRKETTAAALNDREALEPPSTELRVVSLAALAIVVQLANSYLFNALHKGGPTWRTGSAVAYVIHQDRMVTWFSIWLRPYMTLWLSRILSWGALATEAVLPALLLLPWRLRWTRRAAILCVIGLHVGFQLFINLGVFSWAMIGYTPFLLGSEDWAWFGKVAGRRGRRITAYFDAGCGICFQIVRVVARLDRLRRIRFVSSEEAGKGKGVPSKALLAKTMVAVDDATGRQYTRADAFAQLANALPGGWLWAIPLELPGLRQLANWGYDLFARRRDKISVGLGFAACASPASPAAVTKTVPPPALSPFRHQLRFGVSMLREAAVLAMLITLISETLFINAAVPPFLKHEQPLWIKRLVAYPRLIQAWSMFASDAPRGDETVVVDAVTVDGRHVDPYSEATSRYPNPGRFEIPPRLDNDSLVFNYSGRIADQGAYHNAFKDWILRYPERTGNPQDRIVKFDAYFVEDDSPPPGETTPRNVRSRLFLHHPR